MSETQLKKIANKLLSGGRSRMDRIKSQRGAMKSYKSVRAPVGANVAYMNGRVTSGPQGPEVKLYDTVANGSVVSTSASLIVDLTAGMPQGTSSSTRLGVRIKIKSIYVKCNIRCADNAAVSSQAHWAIVLDKQQDSTAITNALIFTPTTSNNTQLNNSTLQRFQVLASGDSSQRMFPGTFLGDHFEKYIPCDIGVRYQDSTGTAYSNGVCFSVLTDATAGNPIQVDYNIRIRYTDE